MLETCPCCCEKAEIKVKNDILIGASPHSECSVCGSVFLTKDQASSAKHAMSKEQRIERYLSEIEEEAADAANDTFVSITEGMRNEMWKEKIDKIVSKLRYLMNKG